MKAGPLDRTITLYSPATETDDGYTLKPGGWTTAGTRKARYVANSPRETFEAHGREATVPVIFEVRSDDLTRTIRETWQIGYDSRRYDVTGIEEIGRRDGLRIRAVANDRDV